MLHSVIMAGGSGLRFWPASRAARPKQMLNLYGSTSMIGHTWNRCRTVSTQNDIWVVTSQTLSSNIQSELPELQPAHCLSEPCARNTAPAIALSALHLLEEDPEAIMLMTPADHVVKTEEQFKASIDSALALIEEDDSRFVLFGIEPDYPSTGYGYIEVGESISTDGSKVQSFKEKPSLSVAQQYLATKRFLWNSGVFIWKAKTIWQALQEYEPTIIEMISSLKPHLGKPTYQQALAEIFPQVKSISIDYAVLERSPNCCVIKAPYTWDDVGSWEAVARLNPADASGNVALGPFVEMETSNCSIQTPSEHLVATYGIDNLIIVHTPDATLVADRTKTESIKQLVEKLKELELVAYL